jgi:hypothetical protein
MAIGNRGMQKWTWRGGKGVQPKTLNMAQNKKEKAQIIKSQMDR